MTERPAGDEREFNVSSIGVMVTSIVASLLSSGTLISSASVFFVPLTRDLGWTQTQFTSLFAVSTYSCAIVGFFLGRATDRYGARKVVLPMALYCGLALCGLRFLNGSYVQGLVLYALAGAGAATAVCYFRLMAIWFRRRMGLALSIGGVLSGLALGSLSPKMTQYVFEHFGWRESFLIWGAVYLLLALPMQLIFARDPAGTVGNQSAATPARDEVGVTFREAISTREIWIILVIDLLAMLITTGLRVHAVPLFREHGLSQAQAVNVIAVAATAALFVRVAFGWCVDRFDTPRVVLPFAVLVTIGLGIIWIGASLPMAMLGMFLLTAGTASEGGVGQYFLTRYYGRKHYGQIVALTYVATPIGVGVGPLVLGIFHDQAGGYGQSMLFLAGLSVLNLLLLCLLRPYRFAAATASSGPGAPAPGTTAGLGVVADPETAS